MASHCTPVPRSWLPPPHIWMIGGTQFLCGCTLAGGLDFKVGQQLKPCELDQFKISNLSVFWLCKQLFWYKPSNLQTARRPLMARMLKLRLSHIHFFFFFAGFFFPSIHVLRMIWTIFLNMIVSIQIVYSYEYIRLVTCLKYAMSKSFFYSFWWLLDLFWKFFPHMLETRNLYLS